MLFLLGLVGGCGDGFTGLFATLLEKLQMA